MSASDGLGLESDIVRLVDYDARWPLLFVAERQRIRDACAPLALRLEHVGGTAIPGMCAKPILDMVAGRLPEASLRDHVVALERAGYEHRGERGLPGREFFRRGQPAGFHLHLVEEDGPLWRDLLALRDFLRSHDAAAREFADLKRDLATRFGRDREAYTQAKTEHVQAILLLARDAR